MKTFNERLLKVYKEILYNGKIPKKEITKKYGKEVNSYLEIAGKILNAPVLYNDEKYIPNKYFLVEKINQLEDRIQREKQTEILRKQTKFNFILAIATSILALATIFNMVLAQPGEISFSSRSIISFMFIGILGFFAGVLLRSLFKE